MKPLPVAPITNEDDWAWFIVMCRNNGQMFGLRSFSYVSDRRDAALMLAWAQGWPIDLGGDDENGECLFWGDPPVPAPEAL